MITVVIPVGPSPSNKQWLDECLDSVAGNVAYAEQIILIDDGAQLHDSDYLYKRYGRTDWMRCYKMPWRTGVSHAFNYGVALARNECVFLLGSDDTLEPNCLERCWEAYLKRDKQDAYYSVPVRYLTSGEVQTIPCNAAMVTKGFWKKSGGFPIESALGRGDNALLSICMVRPDVLPVVWVGHETGHDLEPLYNYREHSGQWTGYASQYHDELISIINKLTANWTQPDWGDKYQ